MQDVAVTIRIVLMGWACLPALYSNRYPMSDPDPQALGLSGLQVTVIGYAGFAVVIGLTWCHLAYPGFALVARFARVMHVRLAVALSTLLIVIDLSGALAFLGNTYRYIIHVGYSQVDEVAKHLVGAWGLLLLAVWAVIPILDELRRTICFRPCFAR